MPDTFQTIFGLILILLLIKIWRDEAHRPTPIWQYRSIPPHPFDWDRLFRIISEPFMRLVSDGVIAHHWDWMYLDNHRNYSGIWLEPDQAAFPRKNFLDAIKVDTRWGWQKTMVIKLDRQRLNSAVPSWYFAYQTADLGKIRKCRISLPANESFRVALGAQPVRILGLDQNNNEVPLIIEGPSHRRDPKHKYHRFI